MPRGIFKGDLGGISVSAVPSSALKTSLDAVTNGDYSDYYNLPVKFSFANANFEVAPLAANELPHGFIRGVSKSTGSYELDVVSTKYTTFLNVTGPSDVALGNRLEGTGTSSGLVVSTALRHDAGLSVADIAPRVIAIISGGRCVVAV